MRKTIFLIIALLVLAAIGATIFYFEVTNYAIDYNQRLSAIENQYDTTLADYESNKNIAISFIEEYATKGKEFVKCSINDVKGTKIEEGIQAYKINYRVIDNYEINKYIAFILLKNGEVTTIENFIIK